MAKLTKLEKLASLRNKAQKDFATYSNSLSKNMSGEDLMKDKKYQALRSNMHNAMDRFGKGFDKKQGGRSVFTK